MLYPIKCLKSVWYETDCSNVILWATADSHLMLQQMFWWRHVFITVCPPYLSQVIGNSGLFSY